MTDSPQPSASLDTRAGRARSSLARPITLSLAWVLLTILVAILLDQPLAAWLPHALPDGTILRRVLQIPNHLFRTWGFVALGLILLAAPRRRPLLIGFGVAIGSCTAALHLLKFAIGRARPEVGAGWLCFAPFSGPQWFDSFPSGHAATSVLLTGLVILYFGRGGWLLAPLVVMAAASRIVLQRHFASDLVGGAGLALFVLYLCTRTLGPTYYTRASSRPDRAAQLTSPPSQGGAGGG